MTLLIFLSSSILWSCEAFTFHLLWSTHVEVLNRVLWWEVKFVFPLLCLLVLPLLSQLCGDFFFVAFEITPLLNNLSFPLYKKIKDMWTSYLYFLFILCHVNYCNCASGSTVWWRVVLSWYMLTSIFLKLSSCLCHPERLYQWTCPGTEKSLSQII